MRALAPALLEAAAELARAKRVEDVEGLVRPVSTLWLIVVVAYYLVRSSIHVAWLSVRPAPPRRRSPPPSRRSLIPTGR